ncbi:GFA family protein [Bdellovibrio bacteriovorus]|uniref:GFA family protein n=1 Tax=Bdellovibrio bacteriovorus TaxID=959 RepID=UPI003AA7EF86
MNDLSSGSCLCQSVTFEVTGAFESFFLCHCKHCQKDTGSAHAANLFSSSAKLNWLSGEDKITTYNLPSTRHIKSFCKQCGAAVPNLQMEGKLLVVPAGSLNTEVLIKPTAHIFCSSQASWTVDLDKVRKFDKLPS